MEAAGIPSSESKMPEGVSTLLLAGDNMAHFLDTGHGVIRAPRLVW